MGEAFRTLEKAMLLELVYPITQTCLPVLPERKNQNQFHLAGFLKVLLQIPAHYEWVPQVLPVFLYL